MLAACRLKTYIHLISLFLWFYYPIKFFISAICFTLQIIKNSDLEELQELGSGTFGTVYHGKWRGTDVAIKRINDRCFAGKPSEQERMVFVFSFGIKISNFIYFASS